LFSFALRRGCVLKNPAMLAERAKVKPEKPAVLSVAEACVLLENAAVDFIPTVELGLFAGLRPESEIWALDWRQKWRQDSLRHTRRTAKNGIRDSAAGRTCA